MSIRPIDLKMAIPQTQELSKVEQNNQDRLKFSLAIQTNEQNQSIDKQLTTVNSSDELSKSKIKEEQNKNNKNNSKKNQEKNEPLAEEKVEKDAKSDIVGTTFDIKA